MNERTIKQMELKLVGLKKEIITLKEKIADYEVSNKSNYDLRRFKILLMDLEADKRFYDFEIEKHYKKEGKILIKIKSFKINKTKRRSRVFGKKKITRKSKKIKIKKAGGIYFDQ